MSAIQTGGFTQETLISCWTIQIERDEIVDRPANEQRGTIRRSSFDSTNESCLSKHYQVSKMRPNLYLKVQDFVKNLLRMLAARAALQNRELSFITLEFVEGFNGTLYFTKLHRAACLKQKIQRVKWQPIC